MWLWLELRRVVLEGWRDQIELFGDQFGQSLDLLVLVAVRCLASRLDLGHCLARLVLWRGWFQLAGLEFRAH